MKTETGKKKGRGFRLGFVLSRLGDRLAISIRAPHGGGKLLERPSNLSGVQPNQFPVNDRMV